MSQFMSFCCRMSHQSLHIWVRGHPSRQMMSHWPRISRTTLKMLMIQTLIKTCLWRTQVHGCHHSHKLAVLCDNKSDELEAVLPCVLCFWGYLPVPGVSNLFLGSLTCFWGYKPVFGVTNLFLGLQICFWGLHTAMKYSAAQD